MMREFKTMNLLRICVLSALVALGSRESRAGYQAIGVYGTGLAANGSLLAGGAIDPHYTLTTSVGSNPGPNAYVISALNPAWVGNTTSSEWINSLGTASDQNNGEFVYTTTFNLAGLDPATASLSGLLTGDDRVFVFLNGQTTGISITQGSTNYGSVTPDEAYGQLFNFSITGGFVQGTNTLTFVEYNEYGGPAGLQVQVSGTAGVVPEPASLALVGIGLIAVGGVQARRQYRKG